MAQKSDPGQKTLAEMASGALCWFKDHFYLNQNSQTQLPASQICDSFERRARRVPREICSDPSVEAKHAISFSIKDGLGPIKSSVQNCLFQADEDYLRIYLDSLKLNAGEYLGLDLDSHLELESSSQEFLRSLDLKFIHLNSSLTLSCLLSPGTDSGKASNPVNPQFSCRCIINQAGQDRKISLFENQDFFQLCANARASGMPR